MIPPRPDLPQPSSAALELSQQLQARIYAAIDDQAGWIGFDQYMDLCLYSPGLGYYAAGSHKFGVGGDFITAPDISPLFSYCLARQCLEAFEVLPQKEILELGAGNGIMAADILRELDRHQALPDQYHILETSPDLQNRQQTKLATLPPHLAQRVRWVNCWPDQFTGVVLANEVIDALPVHRFEYNSDQYLEWGVSYDSSGLYAAHGRPRTELADALGSLAPYQATWPMPYQSEYAVFQQGWISTMADSLDQAVVLLIDYGHSESEYYHPQRANGTMQCHYRHRSHNDPFLLPGLQDITAHVNFTALAQSAARNHLNLLGYTTQAQFLLGAGITDMVQPANHPKALSSIQQIKQLTLPNAMGESFKVMALARNCGPTLSGFQLRDLRHQL